MPVTIGGKPEHNFDEPLGLLSDCHRRIERFLEVLARIADEGFTDENRSALGVALRYFREAAPRHTADEEESLFPRLRACGGSDALADLESDHHSARLLHEEIDALFSRWEDAGISADEITRLRGALVELRGIYAEHIRIEDELVFPLAGRTLDRETQLAIGREMAERRGIYIR